MQTIGDDELAEAEAGARAGNLRELYYFVHGLAERGRVEEAIAFAHERAAEEGRTEPLAYLAEAVYADHGSSPNQAEWKRLMMIDALSDNSLENAESARELACNAEDFDHDEREAFRWFKRGAELGCQESAIALGYLYLDGPPELRNPVEATKWFLRCREGVLNDYRVFSGDEAWPLSTEGRWVDDELHLRIVQACSVDQIAALHALLLPVISSGNATGAGVPT